jgi:hypothetical protein
MNKPDISTQTYNKVFIPDLRSLTYDAAIAWLLFLALNPFTGCFGHLYFTGHRIKTI